MSSITISLPPPTEARLRERASSRGLTLEAYLQELLQAAVIHEHSLTPDDLERVLDELASSLPPMPPLPATLSRADYYESAPT